MGLIAGFLATNSEKERLKSLELEHALYTERVKAWRVALDAYDESGGFLDGAYLWEFPREDGEQYKRRRRQARYNNYAETIVDIYRRSLTQGIKRQSTDANLMAWWDDVDGGGKSMTEYIASVLGQALASGHAAILCDKRTDAAVGPSVAEDTAPYLQTFSSVDIPDWRVDRSGIQAIKLKEAPKPIGMTEPMPDEKGYLLWDTDAWIRFSAKGEFLGTGEHGLGVVPIRVVRPKPSQNHRFIGKPLISPTLSLALYNRSSEEDLVLRDQAFSLFVVSVPIDARPEDLQAVQDQLGAGVGTTTVAVIKGNADFRTADMQVPAALRESQKAIVHEMFRRAHLEFRRESLDAESAEAIRLQRTELEQTLVSLSEELTRVEEDLAWLYFKWQAPGDADSAYERANVEITYPNDFSLPDLEKELTNIQLAIGMDLGRTASTELKQRVVAIMLPDITDETLQAVRSEIESAPNGLASQNPAASGRAAARLRQLGIEVAA